MSHARFFISTPKNGSFLSSIRDVFRALEKCNVDSAGKIIMREEENLDREDLDGSDVSWEVLPLSSIERIRLRMYYRICSRGIWV